MSAQNAASTTVAEQVAFAAPRLSIAVLPFENLSGASDQDYFADGITEDLTTDLSRIPGSFVIARNSAFTYKGRTLDVKQIGRELGVRYVLEGSVRRTGDAVRVNAQLVDAESGAHLWADRFDSDLADLAALQNDITGRIASSLNIELIEAESRRSLRERPTNPDALDLAMRGWAVWYRPRSKENNAEARALFEQAVQLDSQSADALAGLALTHATDVGNGFSKAPPEQLRLAEDAMARALAIDPGHAMAHYARGITAMMRGKIDQAMRPDRYEQAVLAFDNALASNRNLALAHLMKANALSNLGRFEEAISEARRGIDLSPRDPQLNQFYQAAAWSAVYAGRYQDAIEWARKSVDAHPTYVSGYPVLASAYALSGREAEARAILAALEELHPGMTIEEFRRDYNLPPANAIMRAADERFYGGLRKAGMPEGTAPTD